MGIQGLLPTLKSIMRPRHVREYAGKRAAVDTYSWLHKAAFTCSKDICLGRRNDRYIEYCMHRVNMLRHFGLHPVLVFDGGCLPMKSDQEIKRARSRKENLERAIEHERLGNQSAAVECYQKAVDITPAIAFRLIQVLRQENVEYVVAPYEADAQMAFLSRNGHVDLVITEDSDLIAYSCPQIFFKMDKYGQGVGFQFSDVTANKDLDFSSFSKRMILELCIMSGCDYLPSLPGMGVKKAHGLIKRFKSYQKVMKHLKFSGVLIDQQYELGFQRAVLTFQHHLVYDPAKREIVHLTDVPCELDTDLDFLGPFLSQTVATAIAQGEVNPITFISFEDVYSSEIADGDANADVLSGSFNTQVEVSASRNSTITSVSQGHVISVMKLFSAPRGSPENASFLSNASPDEMASQATSSSTISTQAYPSPVSISSSSCEQSPIFETPPSQGSPLATEELDLDAGLPRTTGLKQEYPPFYRRIHSFTDVKQNDENVSEFTLDRQTTSTTVEVKARKPFVPPLLQSAAAQQTNAATKFTVKRSGYISRLAPSELHSTGPGIFSEDERKRNTDENSLRSSCANTQNISEGVELADHMECNNDVTNSRDVYKNQTVLKDVTNRAQSDAIAGGKSKSPPVISMPVNPVERYRIPPFQSELLVARPVKTRSLSSASHGRCAQRSMNEFMSSSAPFRSAPLGSRISWPPSKNGTRASGLRAPSKSAHKGSSFRNDQEKLPVNAETRSIGEVTRL